MGRILFWAIATVMLAGATHLAVVLFTPDISMASLIGRITAATAVNRMVVLEPEETATLVHEINPDLAYAVCPYDIADNDLQITLEIPDTYWSISIYNERGDNIYTLNDRQAGASYLVLRLVQKASASDETLVPSLTEGNAVVVRTSSLRGVIMLRAMVPNGAYRQRIRDTLNASRCAPRARETS